ncbi:hypothetical protein OOT00_05615 [Desulfobotulus sp. H1]|uniref:Aromatic ring-opening dioxygenase LigA n=1 Tax=Desulfobotulus pelophilus TaxID=2823377 RepID=A0ABT3N7N2_9BACT|nr:hypothetical protein [Desulfobotulus pelophilus]MCW7753464.1 hypothetical protein [Desulfobotulus pelophilus]
MKSIKLRVVNQSADANNSDIVIFQKNIAPSFDQLAVAWRCIRNLGRDCNHPFEYDLDMEVCASDSWGNYTERFNAFPGNKFSMQKDHSGDVLKQEGRSVSPKEVEVYNALDMGAVTANIYRSGKLLAAKTGIAPGQKAVFQFKPTIYIGVASQIVEGQVMSSAIMTAINTEVSLLGVASADIVMTGGGPGREATPFVFTLENVIWA